MRGAAASPASADLDDAVPARFGTAARSATARAHSRPRTRRVLLLHTGAAPAANIRLPAACWVPVGRCDLATTPPEVLGLEIAERGVHSLVVLLAADAPDALASRILRLHHHGRPVYILPWSPPLRRTAPPAGFAPPLGARDTAAKRALDLLIGLPALLVLLPVMIVVAALIRRDSPGPALFRQHRVGRHGRLFEMYKFRTMYHQPEQAEAALRAVAPDTPPAPGHAYKLPDDPRITRLGRFLRRSSLDELPQLLNVLRGDMSLVGPRPELPGVMPRYATWQLARLAVPPGMTGWWQVNGRSNHPMHRSTDEDLFYLAHYSLWLDLRILVRTVAAVVRGTGAY